jgi:hypothetical protein
VTAVLGFWEVRSNLTNIQKLSHFECPVNVIRDGVTKQVSSIDLVVGDVLEITPFSIAPCGIFITWQYWDASGSCPARTKAFFSFAPYWLSVLPP